jgi:XTP/dITP diphosphohydrolase
MRQLVLASGNLHKLAELQALLQPAGVQLLAQNTLGVSEAEEPHITFVENALAKARHAAQHTQLPALADDSGLCVDALQGAPGVRSARYAALFNQPHGDAHNNRVLLQNLVGIAPRSARFVSALVAVRNAEDPEPLIAFGRWEGEVLTAPRGSQGFGYDPLLFIPALSRSVAELSAAQKNLHSHRAIAARQMLALLQDVWRCG